MTLVQDWRRRGYGGLFNMGGVKPSTAPPTPWGRGVQSFHKMLEQKTIVGSKCLF